MTDSEQLRIFSRNLNYYIAQSGKQQKEIAKDLGYNYKTFNGWCTGRILPRMGKVQKIADYLGIGKSDLLDDKFTQTPTATDQFTDLFNLLDLTDQQTILNNMRFLLANDKYTQKKEYRIG